MSVTPRRRGLSPALYLFAIVLAGCGANSCSCLSPLPNGFPAAAREPNAAQVRVSNTGLQAITADPAALVGALVGGMGGLTFEVPANCAGSPSTCCPGGNPVSPCGPIVIDLEARPGDEPRLAVVPVQGAGRLDVTMYARVHTAMDIPVNIPVFGDCGIAIDTAPGADPDIKVALPVNFVQDAQASTTRVQAGTVTITQLTTEDVRITGNVGCQLASLGIGIFLGTLTSTFADAIAGAINDQTCKACPSGAVAECGGFATACTDNVCMKDATTCLQELGVTGRLAGTGLLPGAGGALDLYEVLGGYATTNTNGIALGMLGGMLPAGAPRDRCGPPATPPADVTVPQSTYFQGNTRPDTGAPFDIAIGVHQNQLDRFAFSAYDGGVLCLTVGTSTVDLLTTDTFGLFLSSLPNLAGGSRPMAIGLRPQAPPTIALGLNTFADDGMGGRVVDDPLLDLTFTALELDFFVSIDDQYIRAFTLVADVHLPIGLEVGATGELTPVLGEVDNAFSNLSVKNSEPLVESPDQLTAIFPMILDLALPQLIGGLGAIQVPSVAGLNISITSITAVDNKAFLAIFGELAPATMMAPPSRVETTAVIVGQDVPGTERFDDPTAWTKARRPRFELALGGSEPDLEWSVRIDQGTWSAWSGAPRRTLSSNLFWMQGQHQVEVRARRRGQPTSADLSPVVLSPLIDTLAPQATLESDPAGKVVRIAGVDLVSGTKLTARWRLQQGAWHEAATPVEVDLHGAAPIELDVELYDEAGNMAPTRGSQAIARSDFHGAPGESGCNCGAGGDPRGGAALALIVGLLLVFRSRRVRARWARRLAVLLVASVLPACDCGGAAAPCGDVDCLPGEVTMGAVGRWNATASDGTRTVITTYDATLGDLVLADVGGDGALTYRAVDGLPDETPTYDPGGYRGGLSNPGPDVGAWTAVGLAGGLVRAAYQDRERHALRFLVETSRGTFASHDVDVPDSGELVGLHTSLAMGTAPVLAYAVTGVVQPDGSRTTELRLARASSSAPADAGDWTITVLASAPTSCLGLCGDDTCLMPAADGMPQVCAAASGTCTPTCGTTQTCVAGACREEVPDPKVDDLIGGTGLFPTVVLLPDGRLSVVFYDRVRTALVVLAENGPGVSTFTETVLDGAGDPDVGMWANAVVDPSGTIHVAYQDALGDQLMYTTFGSSPGTPEVVDDGQRTGDRTHSVGAGAAIWLAGGTPHIAYQDGTSSNLVTAVKNGTWTHSELATGALLDGFHIAIPAAGGRLVWDQLDKTHSPPHVLSSQLAP